MGVIVGVNVLVGVYVMVGVLDGVYEGVKVIVGVNVFEAVGVLDAVGVFEAVGVRDAVDVRVGVLEAVGVRDGVYVIVGVFVMVGVGGLVTLMERSMPVESQEILPFGAIMTYNISFMFTATVFKAAPPVPAENACEPPSGIVPLARFVEFFSTNQETPSPQPR